MIVTALPREWLISASDYSFIKHTHANTHCERPKHRVRRRMENTQKVSGVSQTGQRPDGCHPRSSYPAKAALTLISAFSPSLLIDAGIVMGNNRWVGRVVAVVAVEARAAPEPVAAVARLGGRRSTRCYKSIRARRRCCWRRRRRSRRGAPRWTTETVSAAQHSDLESEKRRPP